MTSFTDTLVESLNNRRLFIKVGLTNGRLGIDSLSAYAMATDIDAVLDGAVFAFCSKMRNQIKLLVWDDGGYWLLNRKVYNGYFMWPEQVDDTESVQACWHQLRVLLNDGKSLRRAAQRTCGEIESGLLNNS